MLNVRNGSKVSFSLGREECPLTAGSSRRLTVNMHGDAYLGVRVKLIQLLITNAIGAVLTACAVQGYEGPALQDSETALIQTSKLGDGGASYPDTGTSGFYLTSVDGKELRNVTGVQVLPGRRCIELLSRAAGGWNEGALCFDAFAGRRYEAQFASSGGRGRAQIDAVWLVDLEADETVANGVFRPSDGTAARTSSSFFGWPGMGTGQ